MTRQTSRTRTVSSRNLGHAVLAHVRGGTEQCTCPKQTKSSTTQTTVTTAMDAPKEDSIDESAFGRAVLPPVYV